MKPSIAHFTFNLTTHSGAARQALALVRHLDEFEAIFFNVERGRARVEESRLDGQRVIHLPQARSLASLTVWKHMRRHPAPIFHLHGLVGVGLVTGLALRKRIVLKTTLLGSDDFDSISRRPGAPILLRMLDRVDVNVALSAAIASINARYLGSERVKQVPNGVAMRGPGDARQAPVFCVVGVVCERKGTHVAIEHFLRSYAARPDARLFVVGPAGDEYTLDEGDRQYLEHCRSLVPPRHVDQVEFTGQVDAARLDEIYAQCLGFFSFSATEGMPNALLEAMSANCVPIVGEMGGVAREIIQDASCGFVLVEDSPLPSLEDIQAVSSTRAPRQRVEEAFGFGTVAPKYAEIYRTLLRDLPTVG